MEALTIEEVFEAYYECRRSKRYSTGALSFEADYETKLIELYQELLARTWKPGRSTCFIVTKPVRREIFAAPFKDRIVHHILINRLNPYFEKYFIKDSYACRVGKGTHAAIARVEHFIRSESQNGKRQAYVLKLDIKGFFMSIDRNLLFNKLMAFLDELVEKGELTGDLELEKYIIREVVFNDPCKDAILKSAVREWRELPADKSLFHSRIDCGLPIGNLTSQVFANFYLSRLDHYIKHELGIKCYVRYVDDCVFVSKDRSRLKNLVSLVRAFLAKALRVRLHPRKIYLQSVYNGVPFLGCYIKPNYTVSSFRVKHNFTSVLKDMEALAEVRKPLAEEKKHFQASINSYLGILRHYSTYRFRRTRLVQYMSPNMRKWLNVAAACEKVVLW